MRCSPPITAPAAREGASGGVRRTCNLRPGSVLGWTRNTPKPSSWLQHNRATTVVMSVTTTIRLSDEERVLLEELAEEYGSRTGAIRQGIVLLACESRRRRALREFLIGWAEEEGPPIRGMSQRCVAATSTGEPCRADFSLPTRHLGGKAPQVHSWF